FYIEDLQSANGTSVDGRHAGGPTKIEGSARVQIGGCSLDLQRAGLPAAVFNYLPEGFLRETRYNFGEAVVEGRTSTIFNAFDTTLGRDVAVKVLRPESQVILEHVLRFVREAQITSQLQHPSILTVYELGLNEQTQLYYTTRFVEGESLGSILDSMSTGNRAAIASHSLGSLLTAWQKACDAVAYANAHGVVHAGLRDDSITLGSFGEVVVISWCFSRVIKVAPNGSDLPRIVQAAPIDAIPPLSPYCAPEIASASWDEVTARTDVYSLGAILYRMVTLHRPILAEDEAAMFEAILNGSIRPPAQFGAEPHPHCPGGRYPGQLVAIAMKALSRRPEDRFQCVPDLQAAVAAWQEGLAR
ncbi:MAG TPA: FHA domain-containing serine/threonine-protein kinase, partial [Chthoniobacteraceae bacterium]|nr:FHA domain-containing serine/threonine-protein kinase [Chthoniobacteraceae bacterium]